MQNELLYLRQDVDFLKKSIKEGNGALIITDDTSYKFKIIQEMLAKNNNLLTVSMLCEIAYVSRSGYYNCVNSENKHIEKENNDKKDFEIILEAYKYRGYNKGAKGICMRLLHMNPPIIMNAKKIRRLTKKYNLFYPIRQANPYRRMAKALKINNVADNILNR